jgi:hypothetical protein
LTREVTPYEERSSETQPLRTVRLGEYANAGQIDFERAIRDLLAPPESK